MDDREADETTPLESRVHAPYLSPLRSDSVDSDVKRTMSLQEYVDTKSKGELVERTLTVQSEPAVKDKRAVILERIKIGIILFFLLVGAFCFALSEEESTSVLHLSSLSADLPLYLAIEEPSDKKNVFEALMTLQAIPPSDQSNYSFDNGTMVFVTVEGSKDGNTWQSVTETFNSTALYEAEVAVFHDFYIDDDGQEMAEYRWLLTTTSEFPFSLTFEYRELFGIVAYEVAIAACILCGVYVLIVFELLHRTLAALIGAFICIAVLSVVRGRPSFVTVINWIDFDTIGLLFGMMIMVGIFAETGFFEWCAVKAYKMSGGNLWYLTLILCLFTAVISAFLDNVTTILLLTPVTVRLCKVLDIAPEPILLAEVMLSNIGGTATPIGDPPNIIIVNYSAIQESGEVDFFNFVLHMTPGVVMAAIPVFVMFYFLNKRRMKRVPHEGKNKEIDLWKATANKIEWWASEEERRVRDQLQEYILTLEAEANVSPDDGKVKEVDVSELEKTYFIHNKTLFLSSMIVLSCVIVMFFLHSFIEEWVELSLAWIALIGALVHLLVSGIHDLEEVLEKVEWATLLFFAGLFILMKGLEELGLIEFIGDIVADLIATVPDENNFRLAAAVVIIIWVSAIVSAFIDNIPYTAAMVPVIVSLSDGELNLPLTPLVWALSFGTCFGGNGTLIGASANVVAVGLAEAQGYVISFNTFFKTGFPVMLLSVFVATIYMLIFHVLIPWGY